MFKDYAAESTPLGSSDIARLTLRGCSGGLCDLHMGGDGSYKAWIVRRDIDKDMHIVPPHYNLVYTTGLWLRVYDDWSMVAKLSADLIHVYRAGEMGIPIELIDLPEGGVSA